MILQPHQIHLHLGLEKPIKILHLTDLHLSLASEKDSQEQVEWSAHRRDVFFREAKFPQRDPVAYFEMAMAISDQYDATVITGDILDGLGQGNIDEARRILDGKDYLFCLGNHEYCTQRRGATLDERDEIEESLRSVFRGDLQLESRIVGGVNLVAINNSYVLFSEEKLQRLKEEAEKGYPILLFCHCPPNDRWLNPEYYGNPGFTDEDRAAGIQVVEYIKNEPQIKAIFAGHYHFNTTEQLGDKTSYILGGLFKGIVGEITID